MSDVEEAIQECNNATNCMDDLAHSVHTLLKSIPRDFVSDTVRSNMDTVRNHLCDAQGALGSVDEVVRHLSGDAHDTELITAAQSACAVFYKIRGRTAPVDESMDDYAMRMVFDTLRRICDAYSVNLPVGRQDYARVDLFRTLATEVI